MLTRNIEAHQWAAMMGDRISVGVQARIGAVAWIPDPTRKGGYREKGVPTRIGD